MNRRWAPVKTFPCISPSCVAMVEFEGQKCFVHQRWSDGPAQVPCQKCKQPIVRGDLWKFQDEHDPNSAVHSQCIRKANLNHRRARAYTPSLFP